MLARQVSYKLIYSPSPDFLSFEYKWEALR